MKGPDNLVSSVYAGFREEFEDCPDHYWTSDSPHPTSARALAAMLLADRARTEPVAHQIGDIEGEPAPRWATNVGFLDTLLSGGFYGLSCLGGFPGLGKSTLAMASAIEAAATLDWNVVYFEAEMGADVFSPRLDSYVTRWPATVDAINHMRIVSVPRGFTMDDIIDNVVAVAGDDRPVLTVIDSINTVAQLMEGSYLDNLRDLALWCMMARRISRAAASFLVVSELNRTGGVKGMNIEHWADVVVKLLGEKEKGWVRVKLQKTRDTQGEKEERKCVRVHHTSRFLTREELDAQAQQMRNAEGGPGHLHLVESDPLDEIF